MDEGFALKPFFCQTTKYSEDLVPSSPPSLKIRTVSALLASASSTTVLILYKEISQVSP